MMIFIDFDDVLFNSKKFKDDFKSMFMAQGVPSEIFDECYVDPSDNRIVKTFNPWLQCERICQKSEKFNEEHIKSCVRSFIKNLSEYLFNDIEFFCEKLGKKNIAIVSFGEKEFQTNKIKNSGIEKFIDQIHITEGRKSEIIEKILLKENIDKEKIFFIDDRVEQIAEVKDALPQIKTILIKRPEGRYQEMKKEKCCDYEMHNLTEIVELIQKI